MSELSPEVFHRLEAARKQQDHYVPNEKIGTTLADKELVMVVGPVAVGKSYLIDHLTKRHKDFGKVRSFATRAPRPDDTPETMQSIEPTDESLTRILDTIDSGDMVNYSVHPTTNALYGTFTDSYPGTYNFLPTLASSVHALEAAPFRAHHTIGLIASIDSWDAWFSRRTFANCDDRHARLTEAALSLDWILAQPDATIVVNERRRLEEVIVDVERALGEGGYASEQHERWAYSMAEKLSDHIEDLGGCHCRNT
jgi:hypothetical protein